MLRRRVGTGLGIGREQLDGDNGCVLGFLPEEHFAPRTFSQQPNNGEIADPLWVTRAQRVHDQTFHKPSMI
ncbi:hypothetical protein GCM10020216_069470 [Nonomuraea helvata]